MGVCARQRRQGLELGFLNLPSPRVVRVALLMMGFSPDGFFLMVGCSGRSGALRDVKSGAGSPSSAEPSGGGGGMASSGCSGNRQCEALLFSSMHYPRSIPRFGSDGRRWPAPVCWLDIPPKLAGLVDHARLTGPRPVDCSRRVWQLFLPAAAGRTRHSPMGLTSMYEQVVAEKRFFIANCSFRWPKRCLIRWEHLPETVGFFLCDPPLGGHVWCSCPSLQTVLSTISSCHSGPNHVHILWTGSLDHRVSLRYWPSTSQKILIEERADMALDVIIQRLEDRQDPANVAVIRSVWNPVSCLISSMRRTTFPTKVHNFLWYIRSLKNLIARNKRTLGLEQLS
ncbi:hypothetical protein ACP70R_024980 [Stipagrostis hirtigluma subsp. patula]